MFKNSKKLFDHVIFVLIIFIASFLRLFRAGSLMGFWYDQGRDALVVWDMIYNHKFTLIGPQMGFTGIFRGGWYYWMIAPFYALSRGNPIYPYIFVITTSITAIIVLFFVAKKVGGIKTAIISTVISSFSMYIISASRWFSDPTPTLLISVLLLFSLFQYSEGKKNWLIFASFLSGLTLQFSAAAEIFYLPALILIVLLLRKKVKLNLKTVIFSVIFYVIPFVPQLIFELRHPGVQSSALLNFIFHEKTFTYAFWEIIKSRILFDYNMIASKFVTNNSLLFAPFFVLFIVLLILNWRKLWGNLKFKILLILSVSPLIFTLFFVSNMGGVYEYYFTGYYLLWILLFSWVYINSWKNIFIRFTLIIFVCLVIILNLKDYSKNYITDVKNIGIVTLSDEINAISWIYKDASNRNFNVDEYVPPVIPYAYEYLFKWLGTTRFGYEPLDDNINLLYTLYEEDSSHPERLQAWLDRQKGIGTVVKEEKFGIIIVQERTRLKNK